MAIKHKRINRFYLALSLQLFRLLRWLLGKPVVSPAEPRPIVTESVIERDNSKGLPPKLSTDKNIIYTYILGNYDDLKEPAVISPGWQYHCFTDGEIDSRIWLQRPIPEHFSNLTENKQIASLLKIQHYRLFDPSVQFVLSMDGSMVLNVDMNLFLNQHWDDDYDLMLVKHPLRNCLYDEAVKVMEYKFDYPYRVIKQMTAFLLAGYPLNNGLNSSGFMIKNNQSEQLLRLNEIWAEQYLKGSVRDQLSLNYAMWLAARENIQLKIKEIDFNWLYKTSGHVQIQDHRL